LKNLLGFFLKFEALYTSVNFKEEFCKKTGLNNTSQSNVSLERSNVDTFDPEISSNIEDLNIGYLIPISCGHNGMFTYDERCIYQNYLKNAKFIQIE
jgi:hypothetical protein